MFAAALSRAYLIFAAALSRENQVCPASLGT